uniref:Uncharacterized protein n=1 Tax=candidate division WOR-3 bacterium TaxID=2052148 RepID=A0A7V0Z3I8_UNCW3
MIEIPAHSEKGPSKKSCYSGTGVDILSQYKKFWPNKKEVKMVEVMNWGGGAQPDDVACRCYCTCTCNCFCSCYGEIEPYQLGEVNNEAALHCRNATLNYNVGGEWSAAKTGISP